MVKEKDQKPKRPFVRVMDREGNEFVCPLNALRDPEDLTNEEKARCIDAVSPRGLVSPL